MKQKRDLTAIIERERDGYVSLCPELDIANQGSTIEEARANLTEALELFFESQGFISSMYMIRKRRLEAGLLNC